jgi:nickel-dependent lactate racemase
MNARDSELPTNRFDLPWGAWYRDELHPLQLPETWQVDWLASVEAPSLEPLDFEQSLDRPIAAPSLADWARGGRSACIVVDDLARPTRAADVLPAVLDRLQAGGLERQQIRLVVATGTHGPLTAQQIAWKVGPDVASQYRVESHDAAGDLIDTGISYGSTSLRLNRTFVEADRKLGIGTVLPHAFAGYSGGAKLVLPGLADVVATARSHKFVQLGLRGGGDPNTNRFRLEIEQLARQIGFDYLIAVVTDSHRHTTAVFAGDPVHAHRAACQRAAQLHDIPLRKTYDLLILNAYPKDAELVQIDNALGALKSLPQHAVQESGVILLTSAASAGLGHHGLFGPGGASYRSPTQRRQLGSRELWLYAPGVDAATARLLHWEGYPFFQSAEQLGQALAARFPAPIRVGILPCAPMQRLIDHRATQENVA